MSTAPATHSHTSRWIKWLVIGLVAAIALSVGLGLLLPASSPIIQTSLDAIKKAGYPITAEDLDKLYPPLPASENSAAVYSNAFLKLALPTNTTNWPVMDKTMALYRTNPLPQEIKQGIADYVEKNAEAINLLHQAALIEKGFYSNGFAGGIPIDTGDIPRTEIRHSAQLLALLGISHVEAGRADLAVQSIIDSLGVPRSLKQHPDIISQMIRSATLGLSCSTLELALNKIPLSQEQNGNLTKAFGAIGNPSDLQSALAVERCGGIWTFELVRNHGAQSRSRSLKETFRDLWNRAIYYREEDYVFYLDTMEQFIVAAQQPFPKRLDLAGEIQRNTLQNYPGSNRLGFLLSDRWEKMFIRDAKCHAELALCRTALGVERYRLAQQNQLPGTLQDLVPSFLPAVPTDPFDGRPVRYKKLDRGYLIYSVGEDRADNGGKEPPPDPPSTNAPPSDITFTVGR